MKHFIWSVIATIMTLAFAPAQVRVDEEAFGKSLGGWTKRGKQAAEYPLSGSTYRTYKPETTPSPDGGIFISVRIDHVRGWLSSDDHAVLEVTVNKMGMIAAAQSNVAIQGRSISSDIIRNTGGAGKMVGAEHAVQVGTDLVADLSAKLLREKIVEAGRVSFPAVLRHNYNLLFQAIRVDQPAPAQPQEATTPPAEEKPAAADGPKLEIKPFDAPRTEQKEPAK